MIAVASLDGPIGVLLPQCLDNGGFQHPAAPHRARIAFDAGPAQLGRKVVTRRIRVRVPQDTDARGGDVAAPPLQPLAARGYVPALALHGVATSRPTMAAVTSASTAASATHVRARRH